MPRDDASGLVEPDIIINGRVLTFAECFAVRVAVGHFRICLTSPSRVGGTWPGDVDRHLASVQETMLEGLV